MVLLLIDNSILDNDKVNSNYFTDNNVILLNTNLGIMKLPYYYNSKHYYRDFCIQDLSNIEEVSKKKNKPVNYAKFSSKSFYNPKQKKGDIISHEYIPTKMKKYNIVPERFKISRIVIWTNETYISVNPFIEIKTISLPLNSQKINFITYSVENKKYFHEYILFPKTNNNLDIVDNTILDLSNIIPLKIKNIKFVIECQII